MVLVSGGDSLVLGVLTISPHLWDLGPWQYFAGDSLTTVVVGKVNCTWPG